MNAGIVHTAARLARDDVDGAAVGPDALDEGHGPAGYVKTPSIERDGERSS